MIRTCYHFCFLENLDQYLMTARCWVFRLPGSWAEGGGAVPVRVQQSLLLLLSLSQFPE